MEVAAKTISRIFQLRRITIFSYIFLLVGIICLIERVWFGLFFVLGGIWIFVLSVKEIFKVPKYNKLKNKLLSSDMEKEKVSKIFVNISSTITSLEDQRDETENTMILTDKRIIFVNIPLKNYSNSFEVIKNNLKYLRDSLKGTLSYECVEKEVYNKIKKEGLRNIVISSDRAFAIDYSDLKKVRINKLATSIKFYTSKKKYGYRILNKDLPKIKEIFVKYIR